jgi:chromosome partitioning protein
MALLPGLGNGCAGRVIIKILVIESQKGGTGKTTLAINLAVAAEQAGRATVILDLDPQASAAGWRDTRTAEAPAVVSIVPARLAPSLAAAEENGADPVIIDTPPHAESSALTAARAGDLVLIPCRPSAFDLRAIGATAELARLAGRSACAVLNAVPPGAYRLVEEAKAAIAVHDLPVSPALVFRRAAFVYAVTAGQAASEFAPEGRAAIEIAALYRWLAGQLWPDAQESKRRRAA